MSIGVVNSQFTPQSKIYLLKGLEIDAMNNTFWGAFDTPEKQFNFFISNYDHIVFENYTYQRKDGTVVVPGLYDDLRLYNYLIYQNGDTGNKSKWIYCFITSLGYLNDNATSISFETDVIQTWRFEIEENFMESYIAYEHRPQFYKEKDNLYPCINTQPENLEIGTDLVTENVMYLSPLNYISFVIIGMTCKLDGSDTYSDGILGAPSQIDYYIFPYSRTIGVGITDLWTDSGQQLHISELNKVLDAIRKNEKLVGKCVSIVISNYIPGIILKDDRLTLVKNHFTVLREGDFVVLKYKLWSLSSMSDNDTSQFVKTNVMDGPRRFYPKVIKNTKILWYPYSYLLISDNNGTNKIFKNELWDNFSNIQFAFVGSPNSSKLNVVPINYKLKKNTDITNDVMMNLDNSFESQYECSLPIISDQTALLMQSSRNSMNVGLSNIRRSNETNSAIASATGNALSAQTSLQNNLNLSVTSRNANLASSLNDLHNKSNMINASINAIGGLSGGIASALTGNIGGAVSSLVGAGLGITQTAMQNQINTKQTNLQNANALANANAQASVSTQSTAISNQLRELTTRYQNQTNIQNAMDSYNARVHDAQATADSIVTGSNDVLRQTALDLNTLVLYAYKPTQEYQDKLNKIWDMRGYATNTIDYPNLHTRKNWNYIQTVKCNIKGENIDPSDLEKIKRAFDNGITLWHTKDVGNYEYYNAERYTADKVDKYGNYKEKKIH
jgi:hypothetical protein